MAGLSGVEIAVSPSSQCPDVNAALEEEIARTLKTLDKGGVLVSTSASTGLASDFDPLYFVKTHPATFPHGAGGLPQGMGLKTYGRLLLERSIGRPDSEGGEDVMLTVSLFNTIQRHEALAATRARMRGKPEDFVRLDMMTEGDFARVYRAAITGARGYYGSSPSLLTT